MSDKSRKATDFGFHGKIAAFGLRALVRQIKKGNNFWISWEFLLPLVQRPLFDKSRKAAVFGFHGSFCCLWSRGLCPTNHERQQLLDFMGVFAAFGARALVP